MTPNPFTTAFVDGLPGTENRESVIGLPIEANKRAGLNASNSAGPNVVSSEKSVALTRNPVPGVVNVIPRWRPAGCTPAVPLKKFPGNTFGEDALAGTASQLISRRPEVHGDGEHAPGGLRTPPKSARNALISALNAASLAPGGNRGPNNRGCRYNARAECQPDCADQQ